MTWVNSSLFAYSPASACTARNAFSSSLDSRGVRLQLELRGAKLPVRVIDAVQGFLLPRVVPRADVRRPLERHVLEHVRHAGLPDLLVHRSHVGVEMEGNDGNFVALDDEEGHPVLEAVLGHRFLEGGEVLEREEQERSA